ncbi:hypothetical protein [Novipirellula sp.]|uniref:hypothetical protein n=1 Tax=Novipirellula sp. TaxID=2795430 RepID=UPI00356866BE
MTKGDFRVEGGNAEDINDSEALVTPIVGKAENLRLGCRTGGVRHCCSDKDSPLLNGSPKNSGTPSLAVSHELVPDEKGTAG